MSILSGPNVCNENNIDRCCISYFQSNGSCVSCPIGTFGINCTDPCPVNYFGLRCEEKCNCGPNEKCQPDIGCHSLAETSGTKSDPNISSEELITLPVIVSVSLISATILLVIFIIKRCFCTRKDPNEGKLEGAVNSSSVNAESSRTNGETNQSSLYRCTLATGNDVYGDAGYDFSNEYDLLELRLRNVSCASADFDRVEQDEYVYFKQEDIDKKERIGNVFDAQKNHLETHLEVYECASDVYEPTTSNTSIDEETYQNT